MNGIVYNTTTGKVLRRFSVALGDDFDKQARSGEAVLQTDERVGGATHYVDLTGPTIKERQPIGPTISTATGEATMSGLPDPTTIKWKGQSAEATGGTATVQFGEPGTYTLTLEAGVTYQPTEIEVVIP